jgi:hypothetical protein
MPVSLKITGKKPRETWLASILFFGGIYDDDT